MITTFKVSLPFYVANNAKNLLTVCIDFNTGGKDRKYFYTVPRDILEDIGAKELASRIYSVFKQHVSRPKSE